MTADFGGEIKRFLGVEYLRGILGPEQSLRETSKGSFADHFTAPEPHVPDRNRRKVRLRIGNVALLRLAPAIKEIVSYTGRQHTVHY